MAYRTKSTGCLKLGCCGVTLLAIAGCAATISYVCRDRIEQRVERAQNDVYRKLGELRADLEGELTREEPAKGFYDGMPYEYKKRLTPKQAEALEKSLSRLEIEERIRVLDLLVPRNSRYREYFDNYPYETEAQEANR